LGMFKSIRTKIIALTVSIVLVAAMYYAVVGISNVTTLGDSSSAKIMNLICENETEDLNAQFHQVEYSLEVMSNYITDNVPPPEDVVADISVLEEHIERVEYFYDSIIKTNPGVVSYYYNYRPEETTYGLFKVDPDRDGVYESHELTDITQYDKDDTEHVAWYYIPVEAGGPVWLDPYYNENYGVYIISYEMPLYDKDGDVFAIIGIDLDFSEIADDVETITAYTTGHATLLKTDGTVMANRKLETGTNILDISDDTADIVMELAAEDSAGSLYHYTYEGAEYYMAFCSLRNDMKFLLSVPKTELNATRDRTVNQYIWIAAMGALMIVIFIWIIMSRVMNPLVKLTEAAEKIGAGNLEVDFPAKTNDEIGVLTETMQSMTGSLKELVGGLHKNAYQDAMTGVGNKRGYAELGAKLNETGESFTVVMFDINNLKRVNDIYGHDKGDFYIKRNVDLIKKVFEGEQIFRIGGDEFIVIVTGSGMALVGDRMKEMDAAMERNNASVLHIWERINIAKGTATSGDEVKLDAAPAGEDSETGDETEATGFFESTVKKADEIMYENKKAMKEAARKKAESKTGK